MDFEAEGLLEGVEGEEARAARLDLLTQLHEAGVSIDELRQAVAEDRLALLPVERVLGGGGERCSRLQVAERSGLDSEFLSALWRAIGLPEPGPDEPAFTDEDVKAAEGMKAFLDAGMPAEGLIETARVIGSGMSRIAESVRTLFGDAFLQAGDNERDLGLRYAEQASHLAPMLGPQLQYTLNLHIRQLVRSDVITQAERTSGSLTGAEDVTACFADLVGFTKLGEQLPPEEIGAVAGTLADMASDIARPPVRMIKTVGDAVMFISYDPSALVAAALSLLDAADGEGENFPQLRSGLAFGQALNRRGDWYGRPVNLASRVCDIARPGSVLATREVRDHAKESFEWSSAGSRRVKGVSEPVRLYRARHPQPA